MKKKRILCNNCGLLFKWEELKDATSYELIPLYVCPDCGAYNFKVIPHEV